MKHDITVFIHRLYFSENPKKGGLDLLLDYFVSTGRKILLIEMPLDYSQKNLIKITSLSREGDVVLREIKTPLASNIVNWSLEFFWCLWLAIKYKSRGNLVISSDPLTTLPAIFLRKIGFFKKHYYHSVDYSSDRFANPIMNFVYKILLIGGIRYADIVGVVTTQAKSRLGRYRAGEIIHIPNSPDFDYVGQFRIPERERDPFSLVVTCADVSHKFMISEMVELAAKLKKDFGEIHLHVVGYFDENSDYNREILRHIRATDLSTNIIFYSQVPRETNMEIVSKCKVGLAFYDVKISHVKYGDSLKIREYAALGLPCVADKNTCTALEMMQAGAGVAVTNMKQAYHYVHKLLSDDTSYTSMSEKALNWAKNNDKEVIMKRIDKEYFKL